MEVSLHLLSKEKKSKDVKKIYSKPQALGQCRNWLESHLPQAELVEVASTSRGAEIASREKGAAAVASELAAGMYKLKILGRNIEDNTSNVTRFLVIGKNSAERTGHDKTSVMFSVKDRVGALYAMLQPFKKYNINLTC